MIGSTSSNHTVSSGPQYEALSDDDEEEERKS